MFSVQNMEELRRLYDSDTQCWAYEFKRRMVEGWTPGTVTTRATGRTDPGVAYRGNRNERWMFPSRVAHDSTKL